jgi:hypothetical protein
MKKSLFDERPELVTGEGEKVRLSYEVEEKTISTETEGGKKAVKRTVYEAYVTRLARPLTYERAVSAIVDDGYPSDKMRAVVNNYLLDPTDKTAKAEMEAMQTWRALAKRVAKEAVGIEASSDAASETADTSGSTSTSADDSELIFM